MIELFATALLVLFYVLGIAIFLLPVAGVVEAVGNKFFHRNHGIIFSESEREEFMERVWLSCKTDDQRENAEQWIRRVAEPWPSKEQQNVLEYILVWEDVLHGTDWHARMMSAYARQGTR